MTQEEKELLLKDLCARLSYEVICDRLGKPKKLLGVHPTKKFPLEFDNGEYMPSDYKLEDIKPYLRPMSDMTEQEKKEFDELMTSVEERCINAYGKGGYSLAFTTLNDWLNVHHFDYRGLIEKGLALAAPKDMYKL